MLHDRWFPLAVGLLLAANVALMSMWIGSGQTRAPAEADGSDYLPLSPGRTLTYADDQGRRFTQTFGDPITVTWFDGSARQVVPVHDSRCNCQLLLRAAGGEVRAVGELRGDQVQPWGEYLVLFRRPDGENDSARHEPVTTPAGHFAQAVRVESEQGRAWFAPGVGMVAVGDFRLVQHSPPM